MNRHAIAAAVFCAFAASAGAQESTVPEQKCLPKPTYPGLATLKSDVEVKAFEAQIKAYKECVMQYISDRKKASKAHDAAASSTADEHNKVMDKIRSDQEAARLAAEPKKDTVTSPSAPKKSGY
jgi:hypothetical protein